MESVFFLKAHIAAKSLTGFIHHVLIVFLTYLFKIFLVLNQIQH